MKRQIGKAMLELHQGDITELDVDAIVNAANNHLWMGGGVAGAIKRKGGSSIEKEAMAKGPVPVGDAVVTDAGKLKARYIIHAVTMGQDLETDETRIRDATANSLIKADGLGLASVAFPALGAGVGGFAISQVARIMLEKVVEHLRTSESRLRLVVFALFGREAFEAFEAELAALPETT